jgi:hypothetical protein
MDTRVKPAYDEQRSSHFVSVIPGLVLRTIPTRPITDAPPHSRNANRARGIESTTSSQIEGAGNAGRVTHPQPRVRNKKSTRDSHHRSAATIRHSLREWFYGLLRALPGESGFLATIIGAMRNITRQLDASVEASGPHDFAVRESRAVRRSARLASTASRTNVRDDRETPLFAGAGCSWICR